MHNSYIDQMLIVQGVQIASDQTTTTLDLEIGYSDQYLWHAPSILILEIRKQIRGF